MADPSDIIYLDNNATTQPAAEVLEAMLPYLTERWGNPSSLHRFGQLARQGVEAARSHVAGLIGCSEGELIFTGGGTEAINTAIRGLLSSRAPRRRIITSSVEHSATRELCRELAKMGVAEVVEIGVDREGMLDMHQLCGAMDDSTALVSIMWGNNETGVLFPVSEIARLCREKRVPFHCDGTQAVGKIPVNVREIGMDVMSLAAHKFHGPKGIGAMYARRGLRIKPLVIGGPQEMGRRGGTENVPGIVGMGAAAELAGRSLAEMGRVAALRDKLEGIILGRIEDAHVNGRLDCRLPNTTNIGFSRIEAEAILVLLSERGVCASAGAACSSGSLEPSHVLKAMGIDPKIAHGSIRFSLSRYTTVQEVERGVEVLAGAVERLRKVMPVG